MRNYVAILSAIACVGALTGCNEEVVVTRMKPGLPAAGEAKVVEDISAELAAFTPPFPSGLVLFEPETKAAKTAKQPKRRSAVAANDQSGTDPEIELVGFGAVDAPHAILLIDGRLEALRVGERFGSVRVLGISPPSVRLRVAGKEREAKMTTEQDG